MKTTLELANASYSGPIFDQKNFVKKVAIVHERLSNLKNRLPFDAVAVTGKSGLAYGFALQMLSDAFPLIVVEKPGTNHHSGYNVQGHYGHKVEKFIILDDCIDTGSTVENICSSIEKHAKNYRMAVPTFLGLALYNDYMKEGNEYKRISPGSRHIRCISLGA
jgi:phosphoribosylpyrophosphate synthetase